MGAGLFLKKIKKLYKTIDICTALCYNKYMRLRKEQPQTRKSTERTSTMAKHRKKKRFELKEITITINLYFIQITFKIL